MCWVSGTLLLRCTRAQPTINMAGSRPYCRHVSILVFNNYCLSLLVIMCPLSSIATLLSIAEG